MPRLDDLSATEAILAALVNRTKVVVLTTYDSDEYVYRALNAGAGGFLPKSLPSKELIGAIHVAARGDALIDPSVTQRLVARFARGLAPTATAPGLDQLTARDHEVLLLVAAACTNAEIAAELHVGDESVAGRRADLDVITRCHASE